ncbi:CHAT domain-containing protein [Streptomyces sp. NPDC056222]|uniref:CHAT domain-containing protein n=1 Tax=Streptomyces sp. NPDC056222 TaxID=3345749 RepID=UPI0035D57711
MTTAHFHIEAAEGGEQAGDSYHVRLRIEGGASESREAVAPLGPELVAALDQPSDASTEPFSSALELGTSEAAREGVGDLLFSALVSGGVGELWRSVRPIGAGLQPLRVCLEIEPRPLRVLPWELLRQDHKWLFRDPNLLWSRGRIREDDGAQRSAEQGPLRVLLVVCNPSEKKLLADTELALVGGALGSAPGRADVQLLDGPTMPELSHEFDRLRPHVLHFIGHGMPAVPGDPAALPFNWLTPGLPRGAARPAAWTLTSTDIEELLGSWQPPLVVLNACRTTADPMDRLGGLSDAFMAAGVGMVVSMQADVESEAAVQFAKVFYKGLACADPVDLSVAKARQELRLEFLDTGEWALPVFHTRLDPASALTVSFKPSEQSITRLCSRGGFRDLKSFLDRAPQRRDAWWALDALDQADHRSLLVVTGFSSAGEPKTGKTWFTLSCLLTCFLRGHRITYVNLADVLKHPDPGHEDRQVKAKEWLDVLRAIREACVAPEQPEPLPQSAFFGFNNVLNSLLVSRPVPDAGPAAGAAAGSGLDEWRTFDDDVGVADERRQGIFRAFLGALKDASGTRSHVVALDQAENVIGDSFSQVVYPQLIRPIAEGEVPPLKLILTAGKDWTDAWLPPADGGVWGPPVTLVDFEKREFVRLAHEYCERVGLDFKLVRSVFDAHGSLPGERVPVEIFHRIARAVRMADL